MRDETQVTLRSMVRIAVFLALTAGLGGLHAAERGTTGGFAVDQVSEGVFLLRAAADRPDLSNSLVVEREDGLLVVGPQASPSAARELLDTIGKLGAGPIRYLVLPNAHAESAGGAATFPNSTLVIGAAGARDSLRDPTFDFGAEVRLRSGHPGQWKAPAKRLPILVVHARTELEDPVNEVELLPLGPAHSRSDMMVLLPKQNILYCGAVLFPDRNPYAGEADVGGWLSILNHIAKMNPALAIPLRGGPLDARQVRDERDSLAWLRGQIELGFVDRIAPERMTDWVLEGDEVSRRFDVDASPSFVRTVIDRALEEAIVERKKRGLM